MNTFKRKALMSAVLGTLGAAGTAQAIYQDPNGLGQALVYPYYTVNNTAAGAFNTLISVVNTATDVKVVKVRFREGKNSREVLDFNLYLSPNDMWTGGVIPASSTDATSPARLVTGDVSCTNPPIPPGGIDFRNYEYVGLVADPLGAGLDRTREGYAEMFEMATLDPASAQGIAATHVHTTTGDTPTCTGLTGTTVALTALDPTGGLSGTGTLINVNSGRDTMYAANAFGQWRLTQLYTDLGTDNPNFSQTAPATSLVVNVPNGAVGTANAYFSTWSNTTQAGLTVSGGSRAASATMMHSNVINEYVLEGATRSGTDWVLTFPTKRSFVNTTTAVTPFTNIVTASGACETISFTYFNREERQATTSGVDFSPFPPGAQPNSLCYESTVLSFRNSAITNGGVGTAPTSPSSPSLVLGSANTTAVSLNANVLFSAGWANLFFAGANATGPGMVSEAAGSITTNIQTGAAGVAGAQTFRGLPVVGFMVRTFDNGNLSCGTATCQGNYGGSVQHSYRNSITP